MGMMQTKTLAQTIKKIPLFAYLSPSQIQSVLGICQLQDFEALTPNILCRTIETVQGGGMVVLLLKTMDSLKQQACTLK